jgi:hypothetical protein
MRGAMGMDGASMAIRPSKTFRNTVFKTLLLLEFAATWGVEVEGGMLPGQLLSR